MLCLGLGKDHILALNVWFCRHKQLKNVSTARLKTKCWKCRVEQWCLAFLFPKPPPLSLAISPHTCNVNLLILIYDTHIHIYVFTSNCRNVDMCLNACMVCKKSKMPTFYCGHRAENYLTSSGRVHETRGYKHVASETIIQCAGHVLLSSTSVFSGLKKWSSKNFVFPFNCTWCPAAHRRAPLAHRAVPKQAFPWRFGSQRCFLTFSGDQDLLLWCHNHLVIHRCWTEVSKLNNPPSAEEYDLIWISCIIVVR